MNHIIGVAGRCLGPTGETCSLGAGKDTVGRILHERRGFMEMALADSLKRFAQTLYPGLTNEQLWGPSIKRSELFEFEPGRTKTVREILQMLGTEVGRTIWDNTWTARTVADARAILSGRAYSRQTGVLDIGGPSREAPGGVAITDVRFRNEVTYLKKNGGKVILVLRPVAELPGTSEQRAHVSERDLDCYLMDNPVWDAVVYNGSSLQDLELEVLERLAPLGI